jgi:hypothetical protein
LDKIGVRCTPFLFVTEYAMTSISLKTLALAGCVLLLQACGKPAQPDARAEEQQGRPETRAIRNTDAIGYAGSAVADKVDAALDANDQRARQLDAAIEQQP